eukprot:TRINITY_DN505_c0_g2_i1.p2 TRINITY_DN505_c0_g2~~TRINITY_DN505_c0_g2_i1.p2  ORF type:complete len:215 (-),score=2.89 TRINITY_DN505_c0_g2_i1:604-1248(-)
MIQHRLLVFPYWSKFLSHVLQPVFSPTSLGTILSLNNGPIKISLSPNKWQYFKYDVALPTNGKLLRIYGEPGPDKILVCASAKTSYPTQKGFADKEEIEDELNGIKAIPLDPFAINSKGQVEYQPIAKPTGKSESVGIKVDKDVWKYFGGSCYISAKNLTTTDLLFSIEVNGTFRLILSIRNYRDRYLRSRDQTQICVIFQNSEQNSCRQNKQL